MTALNWRKLLSRHGSGGNFLARLRRDQKGNTLALMAAALIPMIGMVGSAVDISRGYLVKTRLQQACDAGVLAARRTMTGQSIASDTNAKTQATNFFNINLKNGVYGAVVTSIVVTDVNDAANKPTGTVHGVASADVPTSLMRIFGKPKLTMNVTCEAELQVSNNDVMFVLDVTGSMNCPAATPSCSNNGGSEAASSKIAAVRTGVVDFYDTLAGATTAQARLRIGIVPYSSNVNVGKLLPASYIADSWTYQSRQKVVSSYNSANTSYGGWSTTSTGTPSAWVSYSGNTTTNISQTSCTNNVPATTTSNGSVTTVNGTTTFDSNDNKSTPVTDTRTVTDTQYQVGSWTQTSTSGSPAKGTCVYQTRTQTRQEQRTGTTTQTANHTWNYAPISYDTSQFKLGNAVTTYTGSGYSADTSTWDGCLEERQTVSNATFPSIPSNAYDLQIDLLPTDDTTKWKPHWPDIVFDRDTVAAYQDSSDHWQPAADYAACPKQASKLAVMTHADVYNYVNAANFKAIGGTYHDVGMIWGARLLSPTGIFASENLNAPNGEPINRHIVFMTDGTMAPNPNIDGLYGYESLDRRISGTSNTPGNPDLTNRHNSRFSALCEAIKSLNITIWVVAYDQTMTTQLQNCASPGKSFYAANDTQMKAALKTIAQQIAELRLSK
ncbi:MAG: hypothetical protein QOH81_2351 [Sphingomonadales bacterium]|jgi:Flp pilus assembly protein TadG|nr:hypothetical protein [Sphingomonadales bacterium]